MEYVIYEGRTLDKAFVILDESKLYYYLSDEDVF